MKKIWTTITAISVILGAFSACNAYDDTVIREEIDNLRQEVEALKSSMNALQAYKTILDKGKVISDIRDNGDGTFTISFADGTAPIVLDAGQGEPGQPGVTPLFDIQDGNWVVSYDEGKTWEVIGSASSGDDFFKSVYMDGDILVLVLIDGTEVRINPKGGGVPEEPEEKKGLDFWLGDWTTGEGEYVFDVEIVATGETSVNMCWGDVRIPFEFEASTGNLLLTMPHNRWIGASEDEDVNYYLNLYNKDMKRINPDEGSLIVTITKETENSASFIKGDASYNGFYARPYVTSTSSWGSSKFWFDVEGSMVRKGSGGDEPSGGTPTKADWIGDWSNSGGTIHFYESGNYLMCSAPESTFSVGIEFKFNSEDGTVSCIDAGYGGWCGTGGSDPDWVYYYFAPYKGNTAVDVDKGDVMLKGTLSSDKKSFTFTSGIEGVTKMLWFTGSTWGNHPSDWIGTYVKVTD